MTISREFQLARWLALGATAYLAAYSFGLISATPADTTPTPPPAAVCTH